MRFFTVYLILIVAITGKHSSAADSEIIIPRINGIPSLTDFEGMAPQTEIAHSMSKIGEFIQRTPNDGAEPSQRTDVYIAYNQTHLFAVWLAFDTEPELIRANLASRENINGDDRVGLTIDTFNDQRTALSFHSTPLGIQWDARWTEGSSIRAGFDTSFEAVWESEGRVTDQGYMVWMSIPLRSLRFREADEQVWRVQFGRLIPRYSEFSFWPRYSLELEGRLNQTALLRGIEDVSPGNNSQFIPFLFTREVDAIDPRALAGPNFATSLENDLGLDA